MWGGQQQACVENQSLSDVMSEQLVQHLQTQDDAMFAKSISDEVLPQSTGQVNTDQPETVTEDAATNLLTAENVNSDFAIAQMMQLEFEKERDETIRVYEKAMNGESKLGVSYSNYRTTDHLESEDIDDDLGAVDNAGFDDANVKSHTGPKGKGKNKSSKNPTKHDPTICGRRHVANTQDFPTDFSSGDLYDTKYDFKLNNRVYNELKQFSQKEKKRYAKIKDKHDISTQDLAVDEKTRITLFKLIDNGTLDEITGIVSTGKEAVIAHAMGGGHSNISIPEEVAIKIFKTTLIEFKSREKYIKDDYRFRARLRHSNPRKLIAAWVEKEMHNLKRLEKFNIPCPHVVLNKKNAIIMDFIGSKREAAPQLKYAKLDSEQLKSAYEQCLDGMRKMYKEAHLIHADLSEYNLLWHEDVLYFIDVSQSIEPSHPNAHFFLHRDCTNIANFFSHKALPGALDALELFNYVTDLKVSEEALQATLLTMNSTQDKSVKDFPDYQPQQTSFDYLHEFIQTKRDSEDSESTGSDSESEDEDIPLEASES